MRRSFLLVVLVLVLVTLAACGDGDTPGPDPDPTGAGTPAPEEEAPTLAPDTGSAADGTCAAFTLDELSEFAGQAFLSPGLTMSAEAVADMPGLFGVDVGADAEGCQWIAEDGFGFIQIATPSAGAFEALADARGGEQGYVEITGVGDRAYAHPDVEQGWTAHALDGDASVLVRLGVEDVEQQAAVDLLEAALTRR